MSAPAGAADALREASEGRALWRHRELLAHLLLRDLKVKYKRSLIGFVWTLLNPILVIAVLTAIFSAVVRMPLEHYWAFLVSGYFVWNFMSHALGTATYAMHSNANLCRAVAFPKEAPVLAAVGGRMVEFTLELGLVVAVLGAFHHQGVPASFAALPLLMLLQLLLALALVFPLTSAAVFFGDVQHSLPVVLTLLFYLSPVFYPLGMVPERFQSVYLANPLALLLTQYHRVLYEGSWPAPGAVIALAIVVAVLLGVGYALFARYKHLFAEIL